MTVRTHITRSFSNEPVVWIAGVCVGVTLPFAWQSISLQDYADAVDLHTLCMLFCLMLVVAGFREEGIMQRVACALIEHAHTMRGLCASLVGCCFFGSMLVTNDISLMVFVSLAYVALHMAHRSTYLLRTIVLQTLAANLGSSLSPVGNPQNIYLQSHYQLGLGAFFEVMGPIVLVGGIAIALMAVALFPKKSIDDINLGEQQEGSTRNIALLFALFACCLLCVAGVMPYWILICIVAAVALAAFRDLFKQVDYALLLTFVFFFVLVANLQHIAPLRDALAAFAGAHAFAASVLSSQVISNVPAAVLLTGFTGDGLALLAGTNVGGLGTPVASLASLISLKLFVRFTNASERKRRANRYLLLFSLTNFGLLLALCAFVTAVGLV